MKLLTTMYTLRRGGAYDRFIMMIESFLERKSEVHCISLTPIQIMHPYYHNHVVALPFGIKNGLLIKLAVLLIFPMYALLAGWQKKIDLYIAFNLPYAFIQAIPKRILKRPMVTFVRGDFTFGLKMRDSLKYFRGLSKVMEYLGLFASDRILAVNTAIYWSIVRVIGSRKNVSVEILHNNILSVNKSTQDETDKIRTKYGIPEDAKVLLTAGILNRGKNIETLLKCIPRVRVENLFILIGGDPSTKADSRYLNYLKELIRGLDIEKRVVFTGWLNKKELWKVFRAADLFVSSSLNEGMPNAMLEALGFDLPCIGSRIPGIIDILQHEELMFDPLDEEAIANKVRRVFSDIQYSNYIVSLCQERKEAFIFDWKERVFLLATQGILS
jgi:glycosyltransferase involved in cell wall biosynthesis